MGHVLLRVETPAGGEEEVSLPPCHLLADLEAELAWAGGRRIVASCVRYF